MLRSTYLRFVLLLAAASISTVAVLACGGSDSTPAADVDASLDSASTADASAADKDAFVGTDSGSPMDGSTLVPKGSRLLGLDVVNPTQTQTFDDNVTFAKSIGANVLPIHVTWKSIEADSPADCVTAGTYTDTVLSTFPR